MNNRFEVLNPWAEADPVPLRGISPRLSGISGKRIGLFATAKRAAKPILTVVEKALKERFPAVEISWWVAEGTYSVLQVEGKKKAEFERWVNGVDAVVTAVGD